SEAAKAISVHMQHVYNILEVIPQEHPEHFQQRRELLDGWQATCARQAAATAMSAGQGITQQPVIQIISGVYSPPGIVRHILVYRKADLRLTELFQFIDTRVEIRFAYGGIPSGGEQPDR